ncbi:hypothetical protein QFZ67_001783 [Streptomyces sp. V1I1]|nr:hypothetical protein [Streptomyces sp. V1I1]
MLSCCERLVLVQTASADQFEHRASVHPLIPVTCQYQGSFDLRRLAQDRRSRIENVRRPSHRALLLLKQASPPLGNRVRSSAHLAIIPTSQIRDNSVHGFSTSIVTYPTCQRDRLFQQPGQESSRSSTEPQAWPHRARFSSPASSGHPGETTSEAQSHHTCPAAGQRLPPGHHYGDGTLTRSPLHGCRAGPNYRFTSREHPIAHSLSPRWPIPARSHLISEIACGHGRRLPRTHRQAHP